MNIYSVILNVRDHGNMTEHQNLDLSSSCGRFNVRNMSILGEIARYTTVNTKGLHRTAFSSELVSFS